MTLAAERQVTLVAERQVTLMVQRQVALVALVTPRSDRQKGQTLPHFHIHGSDVHDHASSQIIVGALASLSLVTCSIRSQSATRSLRE